MTYPLPLEAPLPPPAAPSAGLRFPCAAGVTPPGRQQPCGLRARASGAQRAPDRREGSPRLPEAAMAARIAENRRLLMTKKALREEKENRFTSCLRRPRAPRRPGAPPSACTAGPRARRAPAPAGRSRAGAPGARAPRRTSAVHDSCLPLAPAPPGPRSEPAPPVKPQPPLLLRRLAVSTLPA